MIDRDALLQPIAGDLPTGEDLAFSEFHDAINEARREDPQGTATGIWSAEPKRANWDQVIALSIEGLTTRSKDLQLAVWLAEGLLHKEGIRGFTAGVETIAALCATFWDDLYPSLEEGDVEARLAPVLALENRTVPAFMQLPITTGGPQLDAQFTLQNLLNAQRIEPLADSNPRAFRAAIESGDVPMSAITAASTRTPTEFYRRLVLDLRACETALRDLVTVLEDKCPLDAPSFTKLFGVVAQMQQTIGRLGAGRAGIEDPPPSVDEAADAVETDEPVPTGAPVSLGGRITSREDAYRHLTEAANYLLATEPHSPVPYLVKRAIRWGDLPLATLLAELLEDDDRSKKLFKLLAMNP